MSDALKFTVDTKVFEDRIEQSVTDPLSIRMQVIREIIYLKDQGIRDGLIALGWTPPGEQPATRVPEGWKLVPVEPTHDMLIVGGRAVQDFYSEKGEYPRTKAMWKAVLSAAPQPPEAREQDVLDKARELTGGDKQLIYDLYRRGMLRMPALDHREYFCSYCGTTEPDSHSFSCSGPGPGDMIDEYEAIDNARRGGER